MHCVLPRTRPRKDEPTMNAAMNTDNAIHILTEDLKNLIWKDYDSPSTRECVYEWYYAEAGYYVFRHKHLRSIHLVKAKSPDDAFEKIRRNYLKRSN